MKILKVLMRLVLFVLGVYVLYIGVLKFNRANNWLELAKSLLWLFFGAYDTANNLEKIRAKHN